MFIAYSSTLEGSGPDPNFLGWFWNFWRPTDPAACAAISNPDPIAAGIRSLSRTPSLNGFILNRDRLGSGKRNDWIQLYSAMQNPAQSPVKLEGPCLLEYFVDYFSFGRESAGNPISHGFHIAK
jgi:hypothetical protein